MGILKATFTPGFGYRFYNDTLVSTQSKSLVLSQEDSVSFSVGTQISGYDYKNYNGERFTFAHRLQFYSTGGTQYFTSWYGDSNNYVSCYLSSGIISIAHKAGGTERTASITPTIVAGTRYNLIFRGDTFDTIDGVNYLKIDFGESSSVSTGGTSSALGSFSAADSTFSLAQTWRNRGESCFRGKFWLQMDGYAWSDAEVASFINSGVPEEPIVNMSTKYMLLGELSGGLPKGLYYDYSSATHFEDFESSITGWIGSDASVARETTSPIEGTGSLDVSSAVTGGGFGYKTFSVSASTTYNLTVSLRGTSGQTVGIQASGDVSGVLETEVTTANGTDQQINIQFTTGALDATVEIRCMDNMNDLTVWNGRYLVWETDTGVWGSL